ncbi:MAG: nucleotidyl transferase AbiEii/AbiGii toxin family protein [Desulfobacterota bacterium]|nr:nucleotidyl transferase AbiEii/AbiGii toxin family protein [Thermodesulfobacteriota bacterium]
MKSLFHAAYDLQLFFEQRGWRYCFIGGIALQRWGRPRLTRDIDVTLLTNFLREAEYIDELLAAYMPRIPDARSFALANRVVLAKTDDGIGIDIALGGLPFEEEVIRRASLFEYLPGISLKTCSAEDLIIFKAFANRTQDWADIETIAVKQGRLDLAYIMKHLVPMCDLKEEPEIITRLSNILEQFGCCG